MANIVESFARMIGKQRDLLNLAGEAEDEGTAALMSDYFWQESVKMPNASLLRGILRKVTH